MSRPLCAACIYIFIHHFYSCIHVIKCIATFVAQNIINTYTA